MGIGCRAHGQGARWEARLGGDLDEAPWSLCAVHRASCACRRRCPASAGIGLNAYRAKARKGLQQLRELKRLGLRPHGGSAPKGIEIVATKRAGQEAAQGRDRDEADPRPARAHRARRAAAAQAAGGWEVWRPCARTDIALSGAAGNPTVNIKTQMENLARRYSGHREARDDRSQLQRPADLRHEGHEGRAASARTAAPGGAVLGRPARPRVARRRDRAPHAAPVPRQLRQAGAQLSAPMASRSPACPRAS